MTDYAGEQEMEMEALSSIFMDDLEGGCGCLRGCLHACLPVRLPDAAPQACSSMHG